MEGNTDISVEILLVEDNPGDVRLVLELFKDAHVKNRINVARDGEEAMMMLRQEGKFANTHLPDLILLDLNLPKKSGKEVLKELKSDNRLMCIPVVVLTTSEAEEDIIETYQYCANSFITKPVNLDQFVRVIKSIQEFWLGIVKLPRECQLEV